jgi:hypothetical protein
MKFTEIFSEFEAGKPIRRKSWPANAYITKTYDSKLSVAEMILQIADADDWELYVESPYEEFLEEMKQYIEDNCVNELKTHFLDITMDSVNLFIEKLNEFTQTIGGDSQSQTLS